MIEIPVQNEDVCVQEAYLSLSIWFVELKHFDEF